MLEIWGVCVGVVVKVMARNPLQLLGLEVPEWVQDTRWWAPGGRQFTHAHSRSRRIVRAIAGLMSSSHLDALNICINDIVLSRLFKEISFTLRPWEEHMLKSMAVILSLRHGLDWHIKIRKHVELKKSSCDSRVYHGEITLLTAQAPARIFLLLENRPSLLQTLPVVKGNTPLDYVCKILFSVYFYTHRFPAPFQ